MLFYTIIGLLIGFVGGYFVAANAPNESSNRTVIGTFFFIFIIFIIFSFSFAPIFGFMAIGEIVIGWIVGWKLYFKNNY